MSEGSVSMLPVIIGGFLAIIGGLSSQLIVHWLSDRREKAKIRRDRIEALVRSVYTHSQWVTDRHRFMVFRGEDYDKPDPFDEASMIQSLYFPSLSQALNEVRGASLKLTKFSDDNFLKHLEDRTEFLKSFDPQPFYADYKVYLTKVDSLMSEALAILDKS